MKTTAARNLSPPVPIDFVMVLKGAAACPKVMELPEKRFMSLSCVPEQETPYQVPAAQNLHTSCV